MPDRFPPPWSITEEQESFAVRDANRFIITWVTFRARDVVGTNADRLTKDQARRIAAGIARLPALLDMAKAIRVALDDR